MAGMGPPPKPAGQRRRRNKPEPKTPLPSEVRGDVPELPLEGASAFTRRWWQTIWSSPMAAMWTASDGLVLARMAQLVDVVAVGNPDQQVMAEIRQLEDRFGLSPMSRRRLGWELTAEREAEAAKADNVTDMQRWRQRLA